MLLQYSSAELAQSGIYAIDHILTGRRYIGRTMISFAERWRLHTSSLRRGKHFCIEMQADWNACGPDAFHFQILEICSSEQKAAAAERRWIEHLFSGATPETTYNTMRAARRAHALQRNKKQRTWYKKRQQRALENAETAVSDALARLIVADELDLTTAVKIGFTAKSGEKYQKYTRLVKAAIARQQQPAYPARESQQRPSVVTK